MDTNRKRPLAEGLCPVYERDTSEYPDRIRVAMEGGRVIDYRIEVRQPHPSCLKAIDNIREFDRLLKNYGGYKYKEKSRKRTGRAGAMA